jgi:IrrE N-terminal-like domain
MTNRPFFCSRLRSRTEPTQPIRPPRGRNLATWPSCSFAAVPGVERASQIAREARIATLPDSGPAEPLVELNALLEAGRFRFRTADLCAARGGREAQLIPQADDSFLISVDPTPPGGWDPTTDPVLIETLIRQRTRFRIAHEIGHSFFYLRSGGQRPRRLLPVGDEAEERFCDAFAAELLLPGTSVEQRQPRAETIIELHQEYDVSVEVAARALADQYRGCVVVLLHYTSENDICLQWASSGALRRAEAGHESIVRLATRMSADQASGSDAEASFLRITRPGRMQIVGVFGG